MENKKSSRASLENKRLLMAECGLVAALALVYGAFESASKDRSIAYLTDNTRVVDVEDILPVVLETPPPPAAPQVPVLSDQIDIVEDDFKVDDDLFLNLEEDNSSYEIADYKEVDVVEEEVIEDEVPWVSAEVKPSFNGGDANEFSKWVNSRLVYPEIAKENGVQGRVTLQFSIGADGRLSNVRVLQSPDESLAAEAVRVVSSSPKWAPGRMRDRSVRVVYTFPVIFQLR